jgi:hypothetical protein
MCLVNKYFSTLEYGNVAKLVDQHERIMMLNAFEEIEKDYIINTRFLLHLSTTSLFEQLIRGR